MVAGRRPVAELLRARRRDVHRVLAVDPGRVPPDIAASCRELGLQVEAVDASRLQRLAGIASHQDVVAFADPFPLVELADLAGGSGFLVVLDEVADPRNLGAVLRVADAMGAEGVVISGRRAAPVTPAVLKASAGAAEWVRLAVVGNLAGALSELRDRGRWLVGLDADGSDIRDCRLLGEPVALVGGAEGRGLRQRIRRLCDVIVAIPMRGEVGSLNVSTAVAIGAYLAAQGHEASDG